MNIHNLYRPFQLYFRPKRMLYFWQQFGLSSENKILDVGGDPFNWTFLPKCPHLSYVNLHSFSLEGHPGILIIADGRFLPFKELSFDVVYSNSVIEHLGSLESQRLFAEECIRVGKSYYIQTPNRGFPFEPHLLALFIHWLPKGIQELLIRNFTIWGLVSRPSKPECLRFLTETHLMNEKELFEVFPDSEIWHESLIGLTKSLMAVKRPSY